ncbi:hypothetical protein KIN20_014939 [Parelaphostrongylus tenuis]|uniref:Uncharacterized protein n=1 Tax=Parelaphostrongylus tenuis TaxID=148309 RepID=A0AAD5QPL6_PARTN|nr:hypothetical protein KIN20_014939 [Parelaphostrongylus tenuis]
MFRTAANVCTKEEQRTESVKLAWEIATSDGYGLVTLGIGLEDACERNSERSENPVYPPVLFE